MQLNNNAVPTFDAAQPLNTDDRVFLQELYDVLDKHGNLDRFGLCLLHDHFDVSPDEILLETNDPKARTLSMEVVKRSELPESKFTSWRIGGPGATALTACAEDKCKIEALTACAQDKCK